MWNYLEPLLHPVFWFNLYPAPLLPQIDRFLSILVVGLFAVGIGLAIIIYLARRSKDLASRWGIDKGRRELLDRWSMWFSWAGVVGYLLYWFSVARVPLFGMRAFFLLWIFCFGWWFVHLIQDQNRRRLSHSSDAERAAYEKWLPKAKK